MTYAEGIRLLRKKMLISQEELADRLGVSFASVNRWENNRYVPTIKVKRKLKTYFDTYEIKVEE